MDKDFENDENETEETEDDSEEELAKEFEEHCKKAQARIDAKLEEASNALQEAMDIAEEEGVPFYTHISFLSNDYVPESFKNSKYKELDSDTVSEISGIYTEYFGDLLSYGGWARSAVCY